MQKDLVRHLKNVCYQKGSINYVTFPTEAQAYPQWETFYFDSICCCCCMGKQLNANSEKENSENGKVVQSKGSFTCLV